MFACGIEAPCSPMRRQPRRRSKPIWLRSRCRWRERDLETLYVPRHRLVVRKNSSPHMAMAMVMDMLMLMLMNLCDVTVGGYAL